MRARLPVLVVLTIFACSAPSATAGVPAGDDPPASSDPDNSHVHKLKPWKARFAYRVKREAKAYTELNSRSDVTVQLHKDQWFPIDCQLVSTTQNGTVLWDHIPSIGWVADKHITTYTDDRLEGSPVCPDPGAGHVWFKQPWTVTSQYRLKRNAPGRTRPAGAVRPNAVFVKGAWTTIQCGAHSGGKAWVRIMDAGGGDEVWLNADALKFWQKGLPDGLPACTGAAVPRHFVVLGDSYAAGIGAGSYYESSGKCWRSSKAYWALLAPQLRTGLISDAEDFEACSGDKTSHLRGKLDVLDRDTALVTVSIGGNDLHFADVVKGCAKPLGKSCEQEINEHIDDPDELRKLRTSLDATYRAIRKQAPNALVLVLGYPELVPPDHVDGCGAMDDADAPRLHRAAVKVNGAIAETVGKRPQFRFVDLVPTFRDHPACNKDAVDWINGVTSIDGPGQLASFHPDATGNLAIAGRLRKAAPHYFTALT
jgi:hypothetical protein